MEALNDGCYVDVGPINNWIRKFRILLYINRDLTNLYHHLPCDYRISSS